MVDDHPLGPFVRRFGNLSVNTQRSYRDAIRLLFGFLAEHHATEPARVSVEQVDADLVRAFLVHIENDRGNCVATCNQRLAAFHSLFRFISGHVPELVDQASQIRAIPARRTPTPVMPCLEKPEIDAILAVPNRERPQGRRDYALLLTLYNTGARASELARVTVRDLTLDTSPAVRFLGKGRKTRVCPLWAHTAEVLGALLGARAQGPPNARVFLNVRGSPITRFGIHALLARTTEKAAATVPSLKTKRVSPHTVRHTTAVHLLRAGVDINTIRAWLGHVSLETTNRYAEVDLDRKAAALETCAVRTTEPRESRIPHWREDAELMAFLTSL